jgi:hypothetical protein
MVKDFKMAERGLFMERKVRTGAGFCEGKKTEIASDYSWKDYYG